jgi:peptidoglycan/xylan/chitin deacetylase (PgdA/CDA1 family)
LAEGGGGRREALARLAVALGADRAALGLRAGPSRELTILAYHRVLDMGPEDAFPFDPELVSASVEDFRWQMQALARACTPIGLGEVARRLAAGEALPPRAVAVTFDDGHRDNHTHAFPILRAAGVPATIFLSTSYIGGKATFWFDRVARQLYSAPQGPLEVPALGLQVELSDVASRRAAAARVLGAMKVVPDAKRHEALAELQAASGVAVDAGERSGALSWDQVREMHAGGVEFGSHTVTHPILSRVDDQALERELADSRREISERLGTPADLLAYPVGGESAYDERTVATARACGYRLGLTYVTGTNPWPPGDPFRLRRLHVERYTSRERFAAMLAFPRLFG